MHTAVQISYCTGGDFQEFSSYNNMLMCLQALTKQLAEILDFSLKFDDLKVPTDNTVTVMLHCILQMNNPSIQNDFSYYRRTMSRKRLVSGKGRLRLDGRKFQLPMLTTGSTVLLCLVMCEATAMEYLNYNYC